VAAEVFAGFCGGRQSWLLDARSRGLNVCLYSDAAVRGEICRGIIGEKIPTDFDLMRESSLASPSYIGDSNVP
jgi:hypothetical protein